MSFVNPALLFGALLFAVPLIIHLLNRQRYRRREWAAMEFLLTAFKKQRRRLRTENLLLLLLRCLIPIVLALAIARPVMRASVGPAIGGSVHHILVFDNSYSMGFKPQGAQSPFARMREMANRLVEGIEERSGTRVTAVVSGIRTEMPARDEIDMGRTRAVIASIPGPQDSAQDLTESLEQVADLVEESDDADAIIYIFTDMQARAFGPEADEEQSPAESVDGEGELFDDTARDLIAYLNQRAEVVVLDVGGMARETSPETADNVQVTGLELETSVAVARTAVPVVATVRNVSMVSQSVEVTLEIDGEQPSRQTIQLEAGAEAQAVFTARFATEGMHQLRASIEGDGLAADNQRHLVVPVRERIRVLIVEGSDSSDPALMDSEHLRALLDPTAGEGTPDLTVFAPFVIRQADLLAGTENLESYDFVVLANVETIDERTGGEIRDALLGGTGLWVMLGDRIDVDAYNQHLFDSGNGPMPIELTEATGYEPEAERAFESEIVVPDHPLFAGFVQDFYRELFQLTPVYKFYGSSAVTERANVLARVRDSDLSPLFVASTFGPGKALFMTSAVSQVPERWNRLNLIMLALPLFHEAARWLSLPSTDPFNVSVGSELTADLPERPRDVSVMPPESAGGGKVLLADKSRALRGGRFSLPAFRETAFAGVYTAEMLLPSQGGATHRVMFAVNPDPAEGALDYVSHQAARDQLGVEAIMRQLPSDQSSSIASGRSDLGLPLLYFALFIIAGEAGLARWVSRRRAG